MLSVQKAIFPGIAIGCLFLVLITHLIANPKFVLATGSPAKPVKPAAAMVAAPAQAKAAAAPAEKPAEAQATPYVAGECPISPNYPDAVQQWCDLIAQYGHDNGLEPNLIAAVMLQESSGNPQAYSRSGAVGLLQVMPRDGLASGFMCANGPCFAARPSMQDLFEPEYNVQYGAEMLAGLINKYGNLRDALRAYGPYDMGYQYADIILGILQRHQ